MKYSELKKQGCTHIITHKGLFGEIFVYGELELINELKELSINNTEIISIKEL